VLTFFLNSSSPDLEIIDCSSLEDLIPSPMETTNAVSLSQRYDECIQSFKELLFFTQHEDWKTTEREQFSISTCFDEYGRFRIWGSQTNVELRRGIRGSLDEALREDNELKLVVHDILVRLRDILHQG
jgi:hypothetical protein